MDSYVTCPHCKFDLAEYEYIKTAGEAFIFCIQCGYMENHKRDWVKSEEKGKECWVLTRKSGGQGCYTYRLKKEPLCTPTISYQDIPIEDLPEEPLDAYEFFKCTYKKDDKWYIKDLIKDVEFEYDPLYFYGSENSDNQESD